MSGPEQEPKGVAPQLYGEQWLASAWGEEANEALLGPGPIRPRPRVARALELAGIGPGLRVLDIACGRGEVPSLVAQAGGYGVGLDYSAAALGFAGRVRSAHPPRGEQAAMELVCADACRLPFADDSFDRVTLLDIVEHLWPAQLDALLGELRRVLRPGGYAVLHTLPNRWVYRITYPVLHRLVPRIPRDPRGPHERRIHVNEQDLPRLHRSLARARLGHRLWLEQHIPAQARWNAGRDRYQDTRDRVYPLLAGRWGRALELASRTPLKLVLCNDIFGVLWKGPRPPLPGIPLALSERLVCALALAQQHQAGRPPGEQEDQGAQHQIGGEHGDGGDAQGAEQPHPGGLHGPQPVHAQGQIGHQRAQRHERQHGQ
jgi:2-polyprenyl-6-hydroxyphenyl methylase/3-demethylubiquinone-9 3-methyltransferase